MVYCKPKANINKEIDTSASNMPTKTAPQLLTPTTTTTSAFKASTMTAMHFNSASSSSKPTVAYALKIYSVEIFQLFFQSYLNKEMLAYFSENVFEKKRIEKWLKALFELSGVVFPSCEQN